MYSLKWFKQLLPAELPQDVLAKLKHLQENLQGSTAPAKAPKPKKEGTDKIISDIVSDLNKLTPDTYKALQPTILQNMQQCLPEQLQRVAGLLLEIASSNRFYTEVYARLFTVLAAHFPELQQVYADKCALHLNFTVASVDPSTDYDAYCVERGLAEKRLAFTAFCTHLGTTTLLAEFEKKFEANLANVGLMDELLDHMLLVHKRVKASPEFARRIIVAPNIPNKIVFKCEDIADLYK
jgi:hypothetical protein